MDKDSENLDFEPRSNFFKNGKLFQSIKDTFILLQSIITIIALILAGYWFLKQEQSKFRADISHATTHYYNYEDYNIMFLDVEIKNIGNVPIELHYYKVRVRQILPITIDECKILSSKKKIHELPEIQWNYIKEIEKKGCEPLLIIRSGEKEKIHTHFIIDKEVKLVEIESIIKPREKDALCWGLSTLYEFTSTPPLCLS